MVRRRFSIILLLIVFTDAFFISFPSGTYSQVTIGIKEGSGIPGSAHHPVGVTLENINNRVKGVKADVCDVGNYLACTGCEVTYRVSGFSCSINELENGCVRVLLFSTQGFLIEKGSGPIVTLYYDVLEEAPSTACVNLAPDNIKISDEFGYSLTALLDTGNFCFLIRGDVYPRESPPDNPICGDGVVGMYDVVEEINLVMGIVDPSDCQTVRADVPNGIPPYCDPPNGEITIFDALVIIDKTLGKANCCEY